MRVAEAEAALQGSVCDDEALHDAAEATRRSVEPGSDLHASPELRQRILGALLRRACKSAWARAGREPA
jgi:CO/xanthine dehydrogenase FAD-binding subunit